jgi:hypothetical protein
VTTAVFHDGVEDGALLALNFIAEKHPVYHSEFGRPDHVLGGIGALIAIPQLRVSGLLAGPKVS